MGSDRGGLSKIYVIRKYLLTHCYRGVFFNCLGMMERCTDNYSKGGPCGRPGAQAGVYPLPTPALMWDALTSFSQRMDLVGISSLLRLARWFLVLRGIVNRH